MKRMLIIGCAALAGLTAGLGLRAWRHSAASAGGAAGHSTKVLAAAPSAPPKLVVKQSSALAESLAANLSLTSGVTRWLLWMAAVEKAGTGDFPQLARLAKSLPGALPMLAARWIESDPHGMLEACQNAASSGPGFPVDALAQQLFETWPDNDPDAVFALLKNQPSLTSGWQIMALDTLFQNRPEQALITMSELGIDSYGPNMGGIAKWAAADPRHAAEVALAHPAGYATERVLETIAKEWAKTDPAAALSFAATQDSGPASALASQVLRQWVEKDLGKASAWFAQADEASRERLLPAFVEAWGKQDTASALQWCLANTEGRQQAAVVEGLIKGILKEKPDTAAALITGMEPSPSRSKAAATFAHAMLDQGWWPSMMNDRPGSKAKPEALAWLQQLDPAAHQSALMSIAWSWGERDPQGLLEYLRTPAGQDAPQAVIAAGLRGLTREKPQEALEWAAQTPEPIRERTVSDAFQYWTRSQPGAALDWLSQLPASDPRREACYLGAIEQLIPPSALHEGPLASLEPINTARQSLARQLATDPAAARQTLQRLKLSESERAQAATLLRLGDAK